MGFTIYITPQLVTTAFEENSRRSTIFDFLVWPFIFDFLRRVSFATTSRCHFASFCRQVDYFPVELDCCFWFFPAAYSRVDSLTWTPRRAATRDTAGWRRSISDFVFVFDCVLCQRLCHNENATPLLF